MCTRLKAAQLQVSRGPHDDAGAALRQTTVPGSDEAHVRFASKADIAWRDRHVRFVPEAASAHYSITRSAHSKLHRTGDRRLFRQEPQARGATRRAAGDYAMECRTAHRGPRR